MRSLRYLLAGLALCPALAAYVVWTSTLLVVFRMQDSPGGLIRVGDASKELSGMRLDFAFFQISQDSDMSLTCASGGPPPESRAGYFTRNLSHVVIVTVKGCDITEIKDVI